MIRTSLALAVTLALTACGTQTDAPAVAETTPAATVAPVQEPVAPPPPMSESAASNDQALATVIAGSWRTPEFVARDAWRHPAETLAFFGIAPNQTVVEITPGGGWYAEIVAPYAKTQGRYVAAIVDESKVESEGGRKYYTESNKALRDKFAASPDQFGAAELVAFNSAAPQFGEANSADLVLTFRNVHNWMGNEGQAQAMFSGFFSVLKAGGALGVVEHRANADVPAGDRSGYVSEAQVIALAEAAGFVLEEKSEINANPADPKDHPNGVWTLPPVSRLPEGDDGAKYKAIGESDRMTLRFRKPVVAEVTPPAAAG